MCIRDRYYALEGVGQLVRNVELVRKSLNPELEISTIVLVMYDARTKLAGQVVDEVRAHFGEIVCKIVIPRVVRLSEAPSYGQPITVFDPDNRGAQAYRDLANEVLGNELDLDEPPVTSAPAPGIGLGTVSDSESDDETDPVVDAAFSETPDENSEAAQDSEAPAENSDAAQDSDAAQKSGHRDDNQEAAVEQPDEREVSDGGGGTTFDDSERSSSSNPVMEHILPEDREGEN